MPGYPQASSASEVHGLAGWGGPDDPSVLQLQLPPCHRPCPARVRKLMSPLIEPSQTESLADGMEAHVTSFHSLQKLRTDRTTWSGSDPPAPPPSPGRTAGPRPNSCCASRLGPECATAHVQPAVCRKGRKERGATEILVLSQGKAVKGFQLVPDDRPQFSPRCTSYHHTHCFEGILLHHAKRVSSQRFIYLFI